MDSLLDVEESSDDNLLSESKDERWSAWIFQVIAALTTAQYHYGFVHNDLHTNNVMWCSTDDEFIYYKLDNIFYRVPTFGNLMKIIDFGRASFWLTDRSELIITDSFDEGNDASGQYNCPPFYDEEEPRIDPNPSFDLCRLAVSMFDALYHEQPGVKTPQKIMAEEPGRVSYETESELYNLLWRWLTDDKGKNILRTPNDNERFPDFDLYKYIAKHAKNCVPRIEAKNSYFEKQYLVQKSDIPEGVKVWEIPLQ
jgi:serine/threonine protein kinase